MWNLPNITRIFQVPHGGSPYVYKVMRNLDIFYNIKYYDLLLVYPL